MHQWTPVLLLAAVLLGSGCPDASWSQLDGQCYWVSDWLDQVDGDSLEEACARKHPDAQPASVHSENVSVFIANLIDIGDAYIGLRRDEGGLNWVWTDGSNEDYINWADEQPFDGQNCTIINDFDGTWYSELCSTPNNFACQLADQP